MHMYMLGTRRVQCTEIRNCRCSSCRVGLKKALLLLCIVDYCGLDR